MAKEPTKKQTPEEVTDPNFEQEIRRRAYAIYEERGREDGHALDDWLRAESECKVTALRAAA
ncbi:MAG TPA: DUF2934 domain-containing protein [Candidatus Bathyarchaeia archaeon]|nr:DUF2934 domain-containing protein [Candidatus Bathyarchaeia archaeon]